MVPLIKAYIVGFTCKKNTLKTRGFALDLNLANASV